MKLVGLPPCKPSCDVGLGWLRRHWEAYQRVAAVVHDASGDSAQALLSAARDDAERARREAMRLSAEAAAAGAQHAAQLEAAEGRARRAAEEQAAAAAEEARRAAAAFDEQVAEARAENAAVLAAAISHAKLEAGALVKQRDDEIAELLVRMERMQRVINKML